MVRNGVTLAPALLAVVAQAVPPGNVPVGESLAGSAVGAFLSTLIVAGILVLVAPDYVERMMAELAEEPLVSFVVGFGALLALLVVAVILVITIVGILLAIPLLLIAWVLWAVGSAIGYLAIATRFVDADDSWAIPIVVAAGISGLLALTGIGGLVGFGVGAAGFGAVLRDLL